MPFSRLNNRKLFLKAQGVWLVLLIITTHTPLSLSLSLSLYFMTWSSITDIIYVISLRYKLQAQPNIHKCIKTGTWPIMITWTKGYLYLYRDLFLQGSSCTIQYKTFMQCSPLYNVLLQLQNTANLRAIFNSCPLL